MKLMGVEFICCEEYKKWASVEFLQLFRSFEARQEIKFDMNVI